MQKNQSLNTHKHLKCLEPHRFQNEIHMHLFLVWNDQQGTCGVITYVKLES
jgi:hypothetical protein